MKKNSHPYLVLETAVLGIIDPSFVFLFMQTVFILCGGVDMNMNQLKEGWFYFCSYLPKIYCLGCLFSLLFTYIYSYFFGPYWF